MVRFEKQIILSNSVLLDYWRVKVSEYTDSKILLIRFSWSHHWFGLKIPVITKSELNSNFVHFSSDPSSTGRLIPWRIVELSCNFTHWHWRPRLSFIARAIDWVQGRAQLLLSILSEIIFFNDTISFLMFRNQLESSKSNPQFFFCPTAIFMQSFWAYTHDVVELGFLI